MGDQNSAFVGPQNLVGYLFDGEIVVFIGENPPKIQIPASTERGSFSPGGGLKRRFSAPPQGEVYTPPRGKRAALRERVNSYLWGNLSDKYSDFIVK